jgi:hypothetical protein
MAIESKRPDTNRILKTTLKYYPELISFLEPLIFVFDEFYQKGGMIIYNDHIPFSFIRPEMRNSKRVVNLHIGLLNRKEGLTVIWAAMHEWGHLNQVPESEEIHHDPLLKLDRETDAWQKAESKIQTYPCLLPYKDSFETYRSEALKSYLNKIK